MQLPENMKSTAATIVLKSRLVFPTTLTPSAMARTRRLHSRIGVTFRLAPVIAKSHFKYI